MCCICSVKGPSECSGKCGQNTAGENIPRVQPDVGPSGRGNGRCQVSSGHYPHPGQPLLREGDHNLTGGQSFPSGGLASLSLSSLSSLSYFSFDLSPYDEYLFTAYFILLRQLYSLIPTPIHSPFVLFSLSFSLSLLFSLFIFLISATCIY